MKSTRSKARLMALVPVIFFPLLLTCFMAGTCMASGKPTAITVAAAFVSSSTARLNGTVSPNGLATTFYWEYGKTLAYGSKTSVWSTGSGTSSKDFWADIGSLSSTTTYHFRFVAENSAGKTLGSDMTFTTTVLKPDVKTGPATQITTNSARVTGTVNPNGAKTSCHFKYGPTPQYVSGVGIPLVNAGTGNVNVALDLTKLHVNSTYYYQLVCQNSSGISYGSDMVFKTKASNFLKIK